MKNIAKKVVLALAGLVVILAVSGLILAYWPIPSRTNHVGVTPEEAARLRQQFTGPHNQFTTTDGVTLFLRRWNPDSAVAKKGIAVLLLSGITAYSGPYDMAGKPLSAGGYTTFGLDYRGHGLSDGNRGDSPGKERWIADLVEAVRYVKSLGFQKVVVLGHSMGVASAICVANAIPQELAGLILLSGAYEGRKGVSKPPALLQKATYLASAIVRPAYPAVEYYREGMTVSKDPLFNYRYTVRFLTMLNVKELRLPKTLDVPILVGVGDQDELFTVEKVKEFYSLIPGHRKEFLVMKNTTHAKIPLASWQQLVVWLDKTYR